MTKMTPIKGAVMRSNVVGKHVLGWLPGFAILEYTGRRTGREIRTPVKVFRHDGDRVIALTYGPDVQWVRNVQASGRCVLRIRGHAYPMVDPAVVTDASLRLLPAYVRPFMGFVGVDTFVTLHPADRTPVPG